MKKKVPVSEKKISAPIPILKLDLGSLYRKLVLVTHYFRVPLFEDRTITSTPSDYFIP